MHAAFQRGHQTKRPQMFSRNQALPRDRYRQHAGALQAARQTSPNGRREVTAAARRVHSVNPEWQARTDVPVRRDASRLRVCVCQECVEFNGLEWQKGIQRCRQRGVPQKNTT